MRRCPSPLALVLLALAAAGCSTPKPGPAPVTAPPAATASPAPSVPARPAVQLTVTGWLTPSVPYRLPNVALTADVPTFPRDPDIRKPWYTPQSGGPSGTVHTLEALAAQIDQTGSPEPADTASAVYIGKLEGDRHIYYLGGPPRPDQAQVYELYKTGGAWAATPICQGSPSAWVWTGTRQMQQNPVAICGGNEGSGNVLHFAVFKGDREIFRAGIEEGKLQVAEPRDGNPPDLIMSGKSQWMDHKLDPWVTERYTFTWKDGAYTLASMERMADFSYRLNRFVALVAAGDLLRAAAEMSPAPAGGLQAYLKQHAPDLASATAGGKWTTDGYYSGAENGALYIHRKGTEGPWFHFIFTGDGYIASVAEGTPPAR